MTQPKPRLDSGELAAQYGYASSFFNTDPGLKSLLDQAVREQWTADKFKAQFMGSGWYRNHQASNRNWVELQARSPAEAVDQINKRRGDVARQAGLMGVALNGEQANQLAKDALYWGYGPAELQSAIAGFWNSSGNTSGQAASTETQIRNLAGDYGVTVSDHDVATMVGGVLRGEMDQNHLTDFVRDQARSKYPGMRGYIDQGFTVRQVASPYTQSYAQILEVDPSSVDLKDAHIQKALQGVPDTKTGQANMQSVYDFERTLRQDPRWQYTKNAHDSLTSVGQNVLRDMGLFS